VNVFTALMGLTCTLPIAATANGHTFPLLLRNHCLVGEDEGNEKLGENATKAFKISKVRARGTFSHNCDAQWSNSTVLHAAATRGKIIII